MTDDMRPQTATWSRYHYYGTMFIASMITCMISITFIISISISIGISISIMIMILSLWLVVVVAAAAAIVVVVVVVAGAVHKFRKIKRMSNKKHIISSLLYLQSDSWT